MTKGARQRRTGLAASCGRHLRNGWRAFGICANSWPRACVPNRACALRSRELLMRSCGRQKQIVRDTFRTPQVKLHQARAPSPAAMHWQKLRRVSRGSKGPREKLPALLLHFLICCNCMCDVSAADAALLSQLLKELWKEPRNCHWHRAVGTACFARELSCMNLDGTHSMNELVVASVCAQSSCFSISKSNAPLSLVAVLLRSRFHILVQ